MKHLNRIQKIVASVALLAFLWFGIFPPWRNGTWSVPWGDRPGCIFYPGFPYKAPDIDLNRLIVIWFLLAVATTVALFIAKPKAAVIK